MGGRLDLLWLLLGGGSARMQCFRITVPLVKGMLQAPLGFEGV